ncbi:MAG: ribosome maturation factor RimP [Candidatus Riflebacteria bacterium]|nr:ribosome maturation factor RimP [Candidatus Riflebacteria bacterium]
MKPSPDGVVERVRAFIENTFDGQYEIYDIIMKSVSRRLFLQVFIDKPDGVQIGDCEKVSRSLSRMLDEEDLIHRRYFLEVSSPGAERILKREVDYQRQIGKLVRWVLRSEPDPARRVFKARLHEYSPSRVVVLTDEGPREFQPSDVEEARAVLEFPRKIQG